jgi:hypothetical protein
MYTQTQPQNYTESVDTTTEERDSDEEKDENYNENRRFSTFNVKQYQQQQDLSTSNNGAFSIPNLSGKIDRENLRPLNIIRNIKYIHIHYRLINKRLNPRGKCSNCSSEMRSPRRIYYQLIHKHKNFLNNRILSFNIYRLKSIHISLESTIKTSEINLYSSVFVDVVNPIYTKLTRLTF